MTNLLAWIPYIRCRNKFILSATLLFNSAPIVLENTLHHSFKNTLCLKRTRQL